MTWLAAWMFTPNPTANGDSTITPKPGASWNALIRFWRFFALAEYAETSPLITSGVTPKRSQIVLCNVRCKSLNSQNTMTFSSSFLISWRRPSIHAILGEFLSMSASGSDSVDRCPGDLGSEQRRRRYCSSPKGDCRPIAWRPPDLDLNCAMASAYNARWRCDKGNALHPSNTIFLGKSLATSALVRRSFCGSIKARSSSMRTFSSSVSDSIGLRYFDPKSFNEPSSPGWTKSNRHQMSTNVFSTGVPVQAIFKRAFCFLAARVTNAFGFLIFCASSQIMADQRCAANENSRSRSVS